MASEWGISPLEIDRTMSTREMWMFMQRIVERHQRRARREGGEDGPMTTRKFVDMLRGGSG